MDSVMVMAEPVPGCLRIVFTPLGIIGGQTAHLIEARGSGAEIPLHDHDCEATMVITRGSAQTLGKDGRRVYKGDVVVKKSNEPHGFTDISEDFTFVSLSDEEGIDPRNIKFKHAV